MTIGPVHRAIAGFEKVTQRRTKTSQPVSEMLDMDRSRDVRTVLL